MRCVVSLAVALALAAQDSQFGVQSRLVLVPVTVTAAKDRIIDGIDPKDFVVLDNGRPQKITVDAMATGVAPIALVVAIQTSGISKAVLEKVHKIGSMIQPLVTGESGCTAVVSFSDRIAWIRNVLTMRAHSRAPLKRSVPASPKAATCWTRSTSRLTA
jgi:hypothetical protein